MPHFHPLPIMPKESKAPVSGYRPAAPYPTPTAATGATTTSTSTRNAGIWSPADDEILLQARASGINWGPIAAQHFPNKSSNACRKRHERLVEKRNGDDWDTLKLEQLAQEYEALRNEIWAPLAARMGEKWTLVESKCMEKGVKMLLATARHAQKRNSGSQNGSMDEQGIADHHSDSGIGIGSDAEMDVDEPMPPSRKHATWPAHAEIPQQQHLHRHPHPHHHQDHIRSRSLPQPLPPLPLYQPPPPPINTAHRRAYDIDDPITTSPADMSFTRNTSTSQRYSPETQNGRGGISIQSVLSPAPPYA